MLTGIEKDHIQKTSDYVRKQLKGEGSGHDWWHILRVWNMAKHIASKVESKHYIVELAALLHDIADHKFHGGDLTMGRKVATNWLNSIGTDQHTIEEVCFIIDHISFKGSEVQEKKLSIEGQIVQVYRGIL